MTAQSIYSISTGKSPAVIPPPVILACNFPIFACNLSRLEPRLAMQAELKLAAMWKATAAPRNRRT